MVGSGLRRAGPAGREGGAMSSAATRTPADVARAAFDAVSRQDPDGIVATGAPGYVDDFVAVGEIRGHDAVRAFFRELFVAFPDFTMTVDRIVADDSAAVVQWHAAGTFTGGPFQGIAPTGRRVEIRGVDVMEVADGPSITTPSTTTGPPSPARSACCQAAGPAPTRPCWPRSTRRPR
jgi:predicted ester cyclase